MEHTQDLTLAVLLFVSINQTFTTIRVIIRLLNFTVSKACPVK